MLVASKTTRWVAAEPTGTSKAEADLAHPIQTSTFKSISVALLVEVRVCIRHRTCKSTMRSTRLAREDEAAAALATARVEHAASVAAVEEVEAAAELLTSNNKKALQTMLFPEFNDKTGSF